MKIAVRILARWRPAFWKLACWRLACGVLLALALGALGAASAQPPLEEVQVALAWLRNGQYSALMVADSLGYFAREGIHVTFIDGGPGRNSIPVVGVGRAQFGVHLGSEVFLARLSVLPVDVVAIGALSQQLPSAYIRLANPGDPEPTPKDLEGKRVGIQADGEMNLLAVAQRNGVDMRKVKVQTVLANAEPLMTGSVDYFAGMLNNQTYQIETEARRPGAPPSIRGKVWRAIRFYQYGAPCYGDVIFTNGKLLRERPDLVRRFLRAVASGLQFTLQHPDATVRLVNAYPLEVERADKLAWRMKVQNPLAVSAATKAHGLLWMDPAIWQANMQFYRRYNRIPRIAPVSEIMTNQFNPHIFAQ